MDNRKLRHGERETRGTAAEASREARSSECSFVGTWLLVKQQRYASDVEEPTVSSRDAVVCQPSGERREGRTAKSKRRRRAEQEELCESRTGK